MKSHQIFLFIKNKLLELKQIFSPLSFVDGFLFRRCFSSFLLSVVLLFPRGGRKRRRCRHPREEAPNGGWETSHRGKHPREKGEHPQQKKGTRERANLAFILWGFSCPRKVKTNSLKNIQKANVIDQVLFRWEHDHTAKTANMEKRYITRKVPKGTSLSGKANHPSCHCYLKGECAKPSCEYWHFPECVNHKMGCAWQDVELPKHKVGIHPKKSGNVSPRAHLELKFTKTIFRNNQSNQSHPWEFSSVKWKPWKSQRANRLRTEVQTTRFGQKMEQDKRLGVGQDVVQNWRKLTGERSHILQTKMEWRVASSSNVNLDERVCVWFWCLYAHDEQDGKAPNEFETVKVSQLPTAAITANGSIDTTEEAAVCLNDLDMFVTDQLFEDTPVSWKTLRNRWVLHFAHAITNSNDFGAFWN